MKFGKNPNVQNKRQLPRKYTCITTFVIDVSRVTDEIFTFKNSPEEKYFSKRNLPVIEFSKCPTEKKLLPMGI